MAGRSERTAAPRIWSVAMPDQRGFKFRLPCADIGLLLLQPLWPCAMTSTRDDTVRRQTQQFYTVPKKNFWLKRRNFKTTAFEFSMPVYFTVILYFMARSDVGSGDESLRHDPG